MSCHCAYCIPKWKRWLVWVWGIVPWSGLEINIGCSSGVMEITIRTPLLDNNSYFSLLLNFLKSLLPHTPDTSIQEGEPAETIATDISAGVWLKPTLAGEMWAVNITTEGVPLPLSSQLGVPTGGKEWEKAVETVWSVWRIPERHSHTLEKFQSPGVLSKSRRVGPCMMFSEQHSGKSGGEQSSRDSIEMLGDLWQRNKSQQSPRGGWELLPPREDSSGL